MAKDTNMQDKAKVVSYLLADRLLEQYLLPILDKYKATVFDILLEEESEESLNLLADILVGQEPISTDNSTR
tara:strand:- start:9070 stop:9285 length:216 start_codon:yes stop_codon:yes gene_type:complete